MLGEGGRGACLSLLHHPQMKPHQRFRKGTGYRQRHIFGAILLPSPPHPTKRTALSGLTVWFGQTKSKDNFKGRFQRQINPLPQSPMRKTAAPPPGCPWVGGLGGGEGLAGPGTLSSNLNQRKSSLGPSASPTLEQETSRVLSSGPGTYSSNQDANRRRLAWISTRTGTLHTVRMSCSSTCEPGPNVVQC